MLTEAQRNFAELLAGNATGFEVNFANGGKFVGKYVPPEDAPKPTPAGEYNVSVSLNNGETREGWVTFSPTDEYPILSGYIEAKVVKGSSDIVAINTLEKKTGKGTKNGPEFIIVRCQLLYLKS